jgi:hypothetical protein
MVERYVIRYLLGIYNRKSPIFIWNRTFEIWTLFYVKSQSSIIITIFFLKHTFLAFGEGYIRIYLASL